MNSKVPAHILIIDDDEDVLKSLKLYFKIHFEDVTISTSPERINELFNTVYFDLVLLDMNFRQGHNEGREGLYWLKHILELDKNAAVVLMTAYGTIDLAVESLKLGASDFVIKPWNNQKLLSTALRSLELQRSKRKITQLKTSNTHQNKQVEGEPLRKSKSASMQAVLRMAERAAPTDANILIRGENGTGKEVLARYIHRLSGRESEPFVSVDLGSLPDNLIEAELYGAKKGAYTDANEDRKGRFEAAQEGSLFLDEIGNMSMAAQQRLLSSLQNRVITPLGSNRSITIDTRIICATNVNLEKAVAASSFREDLLYRINTIELHIPPLRERTEDLEDLVQHFLNVFNRRYHRNCLITDVAIQSLKDYSWPGNIRELQHSLERAVILSDDSRLGPNHFQLRQKENSENHDELIAMSLEELESYHIKNVLHYYDGNISKAAKQLSVNRNTLYRKIEKYGL